MKNFISLLTAIAVLYACNQDDDSGSDTNLVGTWKLIENLADPGDGSGTFNPVNSNKTITFNSDGTFTSNGYICDLSIESDQSTSGTYLASNATFRSDDCFDPDYEYHFEQSGVILFITYPCIEACQAKYQKI